MNLILQLDLPLTIPAVESPLRKWQRLNNVETVQLRAQTRHWAALWEAAGGGDTVTGTSELEACFWLAVKLGLVWYQTGRVPFDTDGTPFLVGMCEFFKAGEGR